MSWVPHELAVGGVYMPPVLVDGILGLVAAALTARMLNRTHLSRHFYYPPLVFVALLVLYTLLFGTFLVRT